MTIQSILLFFFSICTGLITFAQNWQPIGTCIGSNGSAFEAQLEFIGNSNYIAYLDGEYGYRVSVLRDDGGGIGYTYLGTPGFSAGKGGYLSTAVHNNQLYVAYRDEGNGNRLSVMRFNGTAWVSVGTPGFTPGAVEYTSMVFIGSTPFVAYKDAANGNKASVVGFNGSTWGYIGDAGFSATAVDPIEIGTDGSSLYVVYGDFANTNKATVKQFNGSNWVTVGTEGFSSGAVYSTQIAFDGPVPYVAFTNASLGNKANVMTFNGSNWVNVGSPGLSDGSTSQMDLAIYDHVPYIGYGDVANCGFQGQGRRATVKKFDGTEWVYVGNSCFNDSAINAFANFYELVFHNGAAYATTSDLCSGLVTKINLHTLSEELSVNENEWDAVTVAPNPVSDRIHIENLPSGKYDYHLTDLTGKTICEGTLDTPNEISLPAMSSGIYLLRLGDSSGSFHSLKIAKP